MLLMFSELKEGFKVEKIIQTTFNISVVLIKGWVQIVPTL